MLRIFSQMQKQYLNIYVTYNNIFTLQFKIQSGYLSVDQFSVEQTNTPA